MTSNDLLSDRQTHQISIKLNRDKPRELAMRKYLDDNLKYGLDRKESILRMFELLSRNGLLDDANVSLSIQENNEGKSSSNIKSAEDAKSKLDQIDFSELKRDIDAEDINLL